MKILLVDMIQNQNRTLIVRWLNILRIDMYLFMQDSRLLGMDGVLILASYILE